MSFIKQVGRAAVLVAVLGSPVAAQDLPKPEGAPVLTITGSIDVTNEGDAAVFDLAMLEALETREFTTTTIWTDGPQEFTGVPLAVLLERVGAEGGSIKATAVNDYAVEIPASDWESDGPMVAYLNHGEPMSLRDKGPLWIVYPFDSATKYQTEQVYSRSIWQLATILVVD